MSLFDMIGGTDYSVGGAINDYTGGDGLSNLSSNNIMSYDSLSGTGGGFNFGSLPIGNITNVLGKLGAGALSGAGAYQASQQPTYIPYTRWLGNGLAQTGILNNSSNKQNQLDKAAGAGQILGNFPGNFFSLFNKPSLVNNETSDGYYGYDIYNGNLDDIYGNNYGPIGTAVNQYIKG